MSRNYDNWERLVGVVLRREQLRQMARRNSRNSSYLSDSDSPDSGFDSVSPPPDLSPRSSSSSPELGSFIHIGETSSPPGGSFFLSVDSREVTISCGENSDYRFLRGIICYDSSSARLVAKIDSVQSLDIRGKMKMRKMTPETVYGAYLVYKLEGQFKRRAKTMIRFVYNETDIDGERIATSTVYLQQVYDRARPMGARRANGWMEVRLGEFYVGVNDYREVEVRLTETSPLIKTDLFIDGIEFRPVVEARPATKNEETEDANVDIADIDIALLQQFVPPSYALQQPNPIAPSVHNWLPGKTNDEELGTRANLSEPNELQNSHHHSNHKEGTSSLDVESSLVQYLSEDTRGSKAANTFCPDWNLTNNSSLQDDGAGIEMMSKLLLPKDDRALASLSRDEIFSGGYGCLSQVVYFFHGMEKLIKQKEKERDDLKYKLFKCEIDAGFVIGAKDFELEELRKTIEALKVNTEKLEQKAKEEEMQANERIKEVQRKLANAEARATVAVESYRISEELKVEKHKFAAKAFSIGFDLCKRQVLEIDPGFDIRRIDVKSIEAAASSSS